LALVNSGSLFNVLLTASRSLVLAGVRKPAQERTGALWRRTAGSVLKKIPAQRNLSLDLGDQGWKEPLSARRKLKKRKAAGHGGYSGEP
jgi:hypothetical protein